MLAPRIRDVHLLFKWYVPQMKWFCLCCVALNHGRKLNQTQKGLSRKSAAKFLVLQAVLISQSCRHHSLELAKTIHVT